MNLAQPAELVETAAGDLGDIIGHRKFAIELNAEITYRVDVMTEISPEI
jgi:hypothetical protein